MKMDVYVKQRKDGLERNMAQAFFRIQGLGLYKYII